MNALSSGEAVRETVVEAVTVTGASPAPTARRRRWSRRTSGTFCGARRHATTASLAGAVSPAEGAVMTKRPTSASPASSRARGRSSTATKASTRSVWARPSAAQRALWSSIHARISVGRCGDWGGPCSGVHASRRSPRVASARETAARVPGARRQSLDRTRRAPVRSTMARRLSRSSGSNARGLGRGGREGQQTVARLTTRRRTDGATVASEDRRWRDAPSGHQHPVHVEEEHFHRVSEPREGTSGANDPIGNVASRSRACAGGGGASPASGARSSVFPPSG